MGRRTDGWASGQAGGRMGGEGAGAGRRRGDGDVESTTSECEYREWWRIGVQQESVIRA